MQEMRMGEPDHHVTVPRALVLILVSRVADSRAFHSGSLLTWCSERGPQFLATHMAWHGLISYF